MKKDGEGLRYNEGKLRMDLLPVSALEEVAKVFTFGASKYDQDNWRRGMSWRKVMASKDRHWKEFKKRNDFDAESGLLHLAHDVANGLFLLEYYRIYPKGDDRIGRSTPRIALDVDDVVADFVGGVMKATGLSTPRSWAWSRAFGEFMRSERADEYFYAGLGVKENGKWGFEPVCYITDRPVGSDITCKWLEDNDLPYADVVTTKDKVEECLKRNVEIFVDDKYDTYIRMWEAGIVCYLMDAPHNQCYDVGWYRIKSLEELSDKI